GFVVRDTGIGIADHVVPKLGTPFTQADSSMSRRFGGTGLGLAIVKNLVELMGGTMRIESQLGRGSVFDVELCLTAVEGGGRPGPGDPPAPLPGAAPHAASISARDGQQGLQILMVEDNVINQRITQHMLTRRGHSTTIAADGLECLRK